MRVTGTRPASLPLLRKTSEYMAVYTAVPQCYWQSILSDGSTEGLKLGVLPKPEPRARARAREPCQAERQRALVVHVP